MKSSNVTSALLLGLFALATCVSAQLPTPAGPILPVEGHPAAPFLKPDSFVAPNGDFVQLTWEHIPEAEEFPFDRLVGQRYESDGTPKGAAFMIDTQGGDPAPGGGTSIGVKTGVFLTEETFAVVWATSDDPFDLPDLYLRIFDGNGAPRSGPRRVSNADFIESLGAVRLDEDSLAIVAAYDGAFEILNAMYGVFSIDGLEDTGMRHVGPAPPQIFGCLGLFSELGIGIDVLPDGDFLVAVSRYVSEGVNPSCEELPGGVFLHRFSPAGDPRGPETRIGDSKLGKMERVKLVPGVGVLLLDAAELDTQIGGQWFSIDGEALAPAFKIGAGFADFLFDMSASIVPSGEILVSWERAEIADLIPERLVRALEVPCTPGPTTLCLEGGRFRVDVDWADFRDREGSGSGEPLSDETGYFTFFNPENVELVVKVLDGSANNGNFWVFYGALSNVEYRLTVTDTENTLQKVYRNPPRNFASVGDTGAFPAPAFAPAEGLGPRSQLSPAELASLLPTLATDGPGLATAGESGTDLSFQGGRFLASVEWRDFQDRSGVGQGATLTDDTGYFWFFRPENIELVVKVLDGRANNGNWWVFYGALSNVEYTLTVEDIETSTTKSYFNPLRTFASDGDTEAFPE